jgi:hypothetical protein
MAKFGQNYDRISFLRNSSVTAGQNGMQFSGMIEDMIDVVVQHASHF